MKLSILCLNYSSGHYSSTDNYHRALERLFRHPPKAEHEVIMVDNGSTDDSVQQFVDRWDEHITVLSLEENHGFHVGNNRGAHLAKGEYLIIHNPDIEVDDGVFDGMLAFMEQHPDVALMSPKLVSPDGTIQDTYRKFFRPTDFLIKRMKLLHKIPYFKRRMISHLMWDMDKEAMQEVDWFVGACMIIRTSMFREVGGYEENFFMYLGDTDLCRKFWEKGWKVLYNPDFEVGHAAERSSGNGFWKALTKRTAWIHLGDMLKYLWKWRGKWERQHADGVANFKFQISDIKSQIRQQILEQVS